MGLFDFVEQHHGIGLTAHLFRQLAAFIVTHISGRRTDQAGHCVPLHVFGHIDSDHGVLIAEHGFCQRLAQLRLAYAGRAEEQEAANGALGILQTHTTPADGAGHSLYGLVLPHHALMQGILHVQQALSLVLRQTGDGDAGPAGHHGGDVFGVDVPVLLIALAALIPLDLYLLLIVLFNIPQLCGFFKVLSGNGGVLVFGKGVDLLLQALQLLGRLLLLHPHPAGSLVHQVDSLVGQKAVVDIPGRQLHSGLQRFIGDMQLVVLLILFA